MDEQIEQVSPAPASPEAVPGIEDSIQAEELSQEEMRNNLEGLMSKIEGKYQDFNTKKFLSESKIKEGKSISLTAIFDLLQGMGIDPSNIEQVGNFLNKIRTSNPELAKQIEDSVNAILGEDDNMSEGEPMDVAPVENAEGESLMS